MTKPTYMITPEKLDLLLQVVNDWTLIAEKGIAENSIVTEWLEGKIHAWRQIKKLINEYKEEV